ncbi:MAG: amidohydrolase family protein [Fibrobacteria bacterium]|nr:amidohydrolase family protein [Fibrobacteria bacterium]
MPGAKSSQKDLPHSKTHRLVEFVLAINHSIEELKKLNEEFVVRIKTVSKIGRDQTRVSWRDAQTVSVSEAIASGNRGAILFRITVHATECSLYLGYKKTPNSNEITPIIPEIPLDFSVIAWRSEDFNREEHLRALDAGWIDVIGPVQAPGKWQVGHAFCKVSNYPLIFIWRCEIPAFFEMHSHIESNHCSPLPPAWVHIWDATTEALHIQPSYEKQDKISPYALGEGGVIGAKPTSAIGNRFGLDLYDSKMQNIFPFLQDDHNLIACLMPMDMEYMHFDGYFGIPVTKAIENIDPTTRRTSFVHWYCWNKSWKFKPNNEGKDAPKMPISQKGETWCWMSEENAVAYEPWKKQRDAHVGLSNTWQNPQLLPFYHFDPRRYTPQAKEAESAKWDLRKAFSQPIQANPKNDSFFGYKLYTSLGWAPMDPYLRDPLEAFYAHCVENEIPVLNHGTPAGYYTHDRRFYFDLLMQGGKVIEGSMDEFQENWLSRFAHEIPGPDGVKFAPKAMNEPNQEPDHLYWFTHHYVSARSWKPVLERFPTLKICLAHFGDSDHLKSDSWNDRKGREPKGTLRDLQLAFDGNKIDPSRTHRFLQDMLDLIQPDNQVFVDLSYVILTEKNTKSFQNLFEWARGNKPILLERILWGTDWPLIAKQDPVTSATGGNMLHRYAKGFQSALPQMPSDFFVRACFLNPLQYLDLKRVRSLLPFQRDRWSWIEDMDPLHFDAKYSKDKMELFYKHKLTSI